MYRISHSVVDKDPRVPSILTQHMNKSQISIEDKQKGGSKLCGKLKKYLKMIQGENWGNINKYDVLETSTTHNLVANKWLNTNFLND
jgi:hypothetical protein